MEKKTMSTVKNIRDPKDPWGLKRPQPVKPSRLDMYKTSLNTVVQNIHNNVNNFRQEYNCVLQVVKNMQGDAPNYGEKNS